MKFRIYRFNISTPGPSHWLWLLSLAVRMVALPWCLWRERKAMKEVL